MKNSIYLYRGARMLRDVYGQSWLQALGDRYRDLHSHSVVNGDHVVRSQRCGLVDDSIASDWSNLKDWRAYLFGLPLMVEAASLLVHRKGVNSEQIYSDAFYWSATWKTEP